MTDLKLQLQISMIHQELSKLWLELQESGTLRQQFTVGGNLLQSQMLLVAAAYELSGMPIPPWLEPETQLSPTAN